MNKNNPNIIRIELESLVAVQQRLSDSNSTWNNVVIQSVDLRPVNELLGKATIEGCQFLGCDIGPLVAELVAKSQMQCDLTKRCVVFPKMPWLPFNPYRGTMYQAEELIGKFTSEDPVKEKPIYEASVDWMSYKSFADTADTTPFTNDSIDTALVRRLRDTSIADALDDLLAPIR